LHEIFKKHQIGWKVAAFIELHATISQTSTHAYRSRVSEASCGIRNRKGREISGVMNCRFHARSQNAHADCRWACGIRFAQAYLSLSRASASEVRPQFDFPVTSERNLSRLYSPLDDSHASHKFWIDRRAELSRLLSSRDRSRDASFEMPQRDGHEVGLHTQLGRANRFFFPSPKRFNGLFLRPCRLRIAINRRDSRGTITQIFPPYITPRVIYAEACKKLSSAGYNLLSR